MTGFKTAFHRAAFILIAIGMHISVSADETGLVCPEDQTKWVYEVGAQYPNNETTSADSYYHNPAREIWTLNGQSYIRFQINGLPTDISEAKTLERYVVDSLPSGETFSLGNYALSWPATSGTKTDEQRPSQRSHQVYVSDLTNSTLFNAPDFSNSEGFISELAKEGFSGNFSYFTPQKYDVFSLRLAVCSTQKINSPPVANRLSVSLEQGDTASWVLSDLASDPDSGDSLEIVSVGNGGSDLTVSRPIPSQIAIVASGEVGRYTVDFQVSDSLDARDTGSIEVRVTAPAWPPLALQNDLTGLQSQLSEMTSVYNDFGDQWDQERPQLTSQLDSLNTQITQISEDSAFMDGFSLQEKQTEIDAIIARRDALFGEPVWGEPDNSVASKIAVKSSLIENGLLPLDDLWSDIQAQMAAISDEIDVIESKLAGAEVLAAIPDLQNRLSSLQTQMAALKLNLGDATTDGSFLSGLSKLKLALPGDLTGLQSNLAALKGELTSLSGQGGGIWPYVLAGLAALLLGVWGLLKFLRKSPELDPERQLFDRPNKVGVLFKDSPMVATSTAPDAVKPDLPNHANAAPELQTLSGPYKILEPVYHATGRIGESSASNTSFGTGVLIAPDLVMTNFHVYFYNENMDGPDCKYGIEFIAEGGTTASDFYKFDGQPPIKIPEMDMAIFRLEKPVQGRTPMSFAPVPKEKLDQRKIALIGYPDPQEFDHQLTDLVEEDAEFGIKRISQGQFFKHEEDTENPYGFEVSISEDFAVTSRIHAVPHNASATPGNSGSPIVDMETGEILGVHYREYIWEPLANLGMPVEDIVNRHNELNKSV